MTNQQYAEIIKDCSFYKDIIDNFANKAVKRNKAIRFFDDIVERQEPSTWIDYTATWSTTPQGEEYWMEINDRWMEFVCDGGVDFGIIEKWYKKSAPAMSTKKVEDYTREDWIKVFKSCSFYKAVAKYYDPDFFSGGKNLNDFLKTCDMPNFISDAFDFEETEEGYDYWFEMSERWRDCLWNKRLNTIAEYYTPTQETQQGESFSVTMPKNKPIVLNFAI